jgi:cytochrome b involved in lipid metabolism
MKNNALWVLIVLVIVGGGVWWWNTSSDGMYRENTATEQTVPTVVPLTAPATMSDVATHNSTASCWTVIDGNVYDLTGWISQHPGGDRAIEQLCGTDGTQKFHGQHKNNKTQADILVTFKIGVLAQ